MARYWVGGASTTEWNKVDGGTTTNWGTASATRDNAAVPTSGDDVIFDNAFSGNCNISATANVQTITFNGGTGYTGTLSGNSTLTTNADGDFVFSTGMTQNWTGSLSIKFATTAFNIYANGKSFGSNISFNNNSLIYLQQDLVCLGQLDVPSTYTTRFDAKGHNASFTKIGFSSSSGTINFGNGNFTLTTSGTIFNADAASTVNILSGTNIIVIDTSASTKTFKGGNKTYAGLSFTGKGGNLIVTGTNNLGVLKSDTSGGANTIALPPTVTTTITSTNLNGSSGKLCNLVSSTPGTAAVLSDSSGTNLVTYTNVTDVNATGGATFNYDANSTITTSTGWTALPTGNNNFMLFF